MNKHHKKNIFAYDKKADIYDNTLDGKLTESFKNHLIDVILADTVTCKSSSKSITDNCSDMTINLTASTDILSVLDVGCGNGTLLSKLSNAMKLHGFGVDLSPQMIANAKLRSPDFNFTASGCESIPFDDNSMDIITVCAAFHHFPDVNKFASEASRLLKAGGHLYVADINLPIIIRHFANFLAPLSKSGDVKIYSQKEIASTFKAVGFRLVCATKRGYIQIVTFQKI